MVLLVRGIACARSGASRFAFLLATYARFAAAFSSGWRAMRNLALRRSSARWLPRYCAAYSCSQALHQLRRPERVARFFVKSVSGRMFWQRPHALAADLLKKIEHAHV